MNLKTEKSLLDLYFEAARIYLLKINASHTKIQRSNDKTIIGLGWAKYRDLSLSRKLIIVVNLFWGLNKYTCTHAVYVAETGYALTLFYKNALFLGRDWLFLNNLFGILVAINMQVFLLLLCS